jgi:hypothetical protein
MSEPDVDHYRYRALLKAADDEPKRLALIQLLISEGARDKLAAKSKVAEPETPLPQPRPFMLPVPTAEALPEEATPSNERERLGEAQISSTADDVSMKFADLAARLSLRAHELESPAFPSQPPEPKLYTEPSIESEPQNVVATFETATGGSVTSIPSEPSPADDLADRIAKLLSGRAAPRQVQPAATIALPSGALSGSSVENSIASRIQTALTESVSVRGPQNALEHVDRGELQHSLKPVAIVSEATNPEAIGSPAADPASTNDLVERFVRLLSRRSVPSQAQPAATIASSPAAPPSDSETENSIMLQIQAALAKQKLDR